MRSWIVHGVDKQTTEPVVRLIETDNSEEARARADGEGIVVLDISPAPRGRLLAADGHVDPGRFRAAMWIRSVANFIRWTSAVGCIISVLMLKTPYVFGPLRPPVLVGFITMGVSIGLVFLCSKFSGD